MSRLADESSINSSADEVADSHTEGFKIDRVEMRGITMGKYVTEIVCCFRRL